MEELKARVRFSEAIMKAIRQGLGIEDIKNGSNGEGFYKG